MAPFVVKSNYEYWWPVKVKSPNADPKRGGATIEHTFNAQFRSISTTETREIMERAGENGTVEFIQAVVIDWNDSVVDDDGQPVPFSDGILADMLTNVWVLKAFWAAWSESVSGQAAGTKK